MGLWALIKDDKVINTIVWDGVFEVDFGDGVTSVEIPENASVSSGDSYENGIFTQQSLSSEEIERQKELALISNASLKTALMDEASQKISVLQDAVDLGMATDEEREQLEAWKKYRVILSRIDSSIPDQIDWPTKP